MADAGAPFSVVTSSMDRKSLLDEFYRAAYQWREPRDDIMANARYHDGLMLDGLISPNEFRSVWHATHAAFQAAGAGGHITENDGRLMRLWEQFGTRVTESPDDPKTFVDLIKSGYFESALHLRRRGFRFGLLHDNELAQVRLHLEAAEGSPSARQLMAASLLASSVASQALNEAADTLLEHEDDPPPPSGIGI